MKDKLDKDDIAAAVAKVHYHVVPETTTTLCTLVLRNGFTVTGRSACVNPANFNAGVGEEMAYADAIRQVWQLEGYLLTQRLFEQSVAG